MSNIHLKWFGGMVPRTGEQHLDAPFATQADNVNLHSTKLRPILQPQLAHEFCQPGDECYRVPGDPVEPPVRPPEPEPCVPVVIETDLTTPINSFVGQVLNLSITVNADATGPLQYRWFVNTRLIEDQTGSTFTYTVTAADNLATIQVYVVGPCGDALSSPAQLLVPLCPTYAPCEEYTCDAAELVWPTFFPYSWLGDEDSAVLDLQPLSGTETMRVRGPGNTTPFGPTASGIDLCPGATAYRAQVFGWPTTASSVYPTVFETQSLSMAGIFKENSNNISNGWIFRRRLRDAGITDLPYWAIETDTVNVVGVKLTYFEDDLPTSQGIMRQTLFTLNKPFSVNDTFFWACGIKDNTDGVSPQEFFCQINDEYFTFTNTNPITSGTRNWEYSEMPTGDNQGDMTIMGWLPGTALLNTSQLASLYLAYLRNFNTYTVPDWCVDDPCNPPECEPYTCDAIDTYLRTAPAIDDHYSLVDLPELASGATVTSTRQGVQAVVGRGAGVISPVGPSNLGLCTDPAPQTIMLNQSLGAGAASLGIIGPSTWSTASGWSQYILYDTCNNATGGLIFAEIQETNSSGTTTIYSFEPRTDADANLVFSVSSSFGLVTSGSGSVNYQDPTGNRGPYGIIVGVDFEDLTPGNIIWTLRCWVNGALMATVTYRNTTSQGLDFAGSLNRLWMTPSASLGAPMTFAQAAWFTGGNVPDTVEEIWLEQQQNDPNYNQPDWCTLP